MIKWVFSVLLYIGTIIVGLLLDKREDGRKRTQRVVYLIWLFIFLCFGYMTGADWFHYELVYNDFDMYGIRYLNEPGSWFVFKTMPSIIPDFWLFTGLFKCIYLYSVYFILSRITDRWMSALSLSIPLVLGAMLIQSPFRFMMGQFFINIALYIVYLRILNPSNVHLFAIKLVGLIVVASLFHNSCIVYLVVLPSLLLCKKIANAHSWLLFAFYLALALISSNAGFISNSMTIFLDSFSAVKDYSSSYGPEDNTAFFTLGSLFQFLIFVLVLFSKQSVVRRVKNGEALFGLTIIYFFIARLIIIIPTGQRILFPLAFFYAVYLVYMLKFDSQRSMIIVLYIMMAFTKKLWTVYDMIPYSNSIPYIVTEHKDYSERYKYNPEEFVKRTGQWPEILDEDL